MFCQRESLRGHAERPATAALRREADWRRDAQVFDRRRQKRIKQIRADGAPAGAKVITCHRLNIWSGWQLFVLLPVVMS